MNYNTTASLEKLTCTIFVGIGKIEDHFGIFSWSQIEKRDKTNLQIQLKVFRRDDKAEFCKHQQIKLGEADFKQLLQFPKPIVVATEDFSREEI